MLSCGALCVADRLQIKDLAARLHSLSPRISAVEITTLLQKKVNLANDEVPGRMDPQVTAEDSIAAFEAYAFIRGLMASDKIAGNSHEARVGRSLREIFFGGSLTRPPDARPVKIKNCHDADTCAIIETQDPGCAAKTATTKVRVSATDAPEVGVWNERLADILRGEKNPYLSQPIQYTIRPSSWWINPKLVENVDKIHLEFAQRHNWDPKKLPYAERVALNSMIAITIDYTGKLSNLVLEDVLGWQTGDPKDVLMEESEIRWISEDTPNSLCGTWQPYDGFGRRLGSFAVKEQGRLHTFIRDRLPVLMAGDGQMLYDDYQGKIAEHIRVLSSSGVKGIKDIVGEFQIQVKKGIPDPAKMYSKERCAEMAAQFYDDGEFRFPRLGRDIHYMQIAIGSVYDYIKYRNQYGNSYKLAGNYARNRRFGLWNEITFRTLWDVNDRNGRYRPLDCQEAPIK